MTEVTLDLAQAYILDRITELRAQLDHGTPTVFLAAFTLMNTLNEVFHDFVEFKRIPAEMGWPEETIRLYGKTVKEVNDYYSLPYVEVEGVRYKFNLSHKDPHLERNESNGYVRFTLNAASLLDELEVLTHNLFTKVKEDQVSVDSALKTLNRHKFIGLGD